MTLFAQNSSDYISYNIEYIVQGLCLQMYMYHHSSMDFFKVYFLVDIFFNLNKLIIFFPNFTHYFEFITIIQIVKNKK